MVYKHSKGYLLEYRPEHPYCDGHGYIPQHRLVVEQKINRFINPLVEDVHHVDGVVTNNQIVNLILLSKTDHRRIHSGWVKIKDEWWKVCSNCRKFLKVEDNFTKRKSGHNEYISKCRICLNLKGKQYREGSRNKHIEYGDAYQSLRLVQPSKEDGLSATVTRLWGNAWDLRSRQGDCLSPRQTV